MKKLSHYLVNIFLVIISFVFFSVPIECCAAETKTNVIFTEVNCYENKHLKYDLFVSENSSISGITVDINYDSRQLKLVKSEVGEVLKPTICKVNSQIESKVILTAISTDAITKEGAILHIEFQVIDTSKQYIDITCSIDECINQNCDELPTVVKSDKIANPLYVHNETSGDKSKESNENKESDKSQGEVHNTDKVVQKDTEEKDETLEEKRPLQNETEVHEESTETTGTNEKNNQDIVPIDNNVSKTRKETKSGKNIIFTVVVIAIIGVTLSILATWIRRKKK